MELPRDHKHFEQPSKPVGNKLLCNSDFLSASPSQFNLFLQMHRVLSAEAAVLEAQVATTGHSPFFLLHSLHHSQAVITWELTLWKWKPMGGKDAGLLLSHCP